MMNDTEYVTTVACFDCGAYTVGATTCNQCDSENIRTV